MPDIFISYSRADRDRVAHIAAALEADGYDLWWDPSIEPGQTFRGEIEKHLKAAKCVIVVWSNASVKSAWVVEEAEDGLDREILVPILLDDVIRDIPRGFRSVQAADLTKWNGQRGHPEWKLVLSRVKRLIEQPSKPRKRYRRPKKSKSDTSIFGLGAFFTVIALGIAFVYWSLYIKDSGNQISEIEIVHEEKTLFVRVRQVAVYQKPTEDAETIGIFQPQEAVAVTGSIERGLDGQSWYQVVAPDGRIGYVRQTTLTDSNGGDSTYPQSAEKCVSTTGILGATSHYFDVSGKKVDRIYGEVTFNKAEDAGVSSASVSVGGVLCSALHTPSSPNAGMTIVTPACEGPFDGDKSVIIGKRDGPNTKSESVRLCAIGEQIEINPRGADNVSQSFRDCEDVCPAMAIIPAGKFQMGDLSGSGRRDELPVHEVTFDKAFAVGVYEVTWDEWEACVADNQCYNREVMTLGGHEQWGKEERPVININWEDAQSYVGWLSRKTGQTYRLLSEAEWEYAARAGSQTDYYFGDEPNMICRHANSADLSTNNMSRSPCNDGFGDMTSTIGFYKSANAFGLYDVHGNVWEWVQDCWHETYEGAPADGRPWGGNCNARVLRGGSWDSSPYELRVSFRNWLSYNNTGSHIGFRVARDLD